MSKIIKNFWNLDESQFNRRIESQVEFYTALKSADDFKNFVFWPNELIPKDKYEYKIENKTFTNCSFAFTKFENIIFQNCKFYNCKFNHAEIISCRFHDCKFEYVNMFKVKIKKTYIEPNSFRNIIPNIRNFRGCIVNANMCVTFFQEILDNSKDEGQPEHTKQADYHFRKWKGLNYIQKRFEPEKDSRRTSNWMFIKKFLPNLSLYILTGYGYRIPNFLIVFIAGFSFFAFKNYLNWNEYGLKQKDLSIDVFNPTEPNISSTIYYTLDCTTKLVDSQFQATTSFGMGWLTAQSLFGFILLSALITIILNKFVR
jgi:uncharacterized protein YjbI with pentapeptide repeats